MMNILTDLLACQTIAEVKAIRRKYIDSLSGNQKYKFDMWIHHSFIRIRRIDNEKKLSWSNQIN